MPEPDEQTNRLESLLLTLIFAGLSLALLLAVFVQTRTGPAQAGWWTRPALAPGVALTVLVLANALTLWKEVASLRRTPATPAEWAEARARVAAWLRPVEFLAYFAAYLWSLKLIGYFPATLVFVTGLMWRVGLRGGRWMLAGALTALALVLIFRVGLGVWMPAPALYDLMPGGMRTVLIRWF